MKMLPKYLVSSFIIILVLLSGCSGIRMISGPSTKDLYSTKFTKEIEIIKTQYRRGQVDQALKALQKMQEENLEPAEKALRRNLVGVIYFGKQNFEQAIFNFNQGLATSSDDASLTSQIKLNLGGSYYKLGMVEKAFNVMGEAPYGSLSQNDLVKFHKLKYRLANELGKDNVAIRSLIWTLSGKQKISELRIEPFYEILTNKFRKLEQSQKYKVLEEFEEIAPFVVGYMSYLEAEKIYYSGRKDDARDMIRWTESNFGKYPEIVTLVKNFTFKVENYARLDSLTIGVILPLSGEKKSFGERALFGIDAALRDFQEKNSDLPEFKIIIKDSEGSGVVGAHQVKELVEKDFASVIIGGLFSLEATKEFEVAKRRGVFFVSLSQIFMNKEDKDHLLLEVPGSIESQVNQLFTSEIIKEFGPRAAIVYPESKRGQAYVNEFWRKSNLLNISVTGVYSYDDKASDFREPVKNLLGLKYPRVRKEEYKILDDIHSLEATRSTRRIQTLKPKIDFDWVFVPAYPLEAIQIIPSFTYFDAFNVPIIGGPSWRSQRLSRESYKFKNIFFVGDDVEAISDSLSQSFYNKYGKKLRLIELRSFDSMKIAMNILNNGKFTSRDELDMAIRGLGKIEGQTGSWSLVDGVWLKKLASLHIRNGKFSELLPKAESPEGPTK
jgi:tetratricopeptide (TPR) repeat protein